jgi:hypothetical protein
MESRHPPKFPLKGGLLRTAPPSEALGAYFASEEIEEAELWLRVAMGRLDPARRAGWKLHLSATPTSLPDLLARALPVLHRLAYPFKVIRDALELEALNDGRFGLEQVGKAVTIYPPTERAAAEAAAALREALRGLSGPWIPTDFRFAEDGPVYYRFAPFDARFQRDALGRRQRLLRHPEAGDVVEGSVDPPAPIHLPPGEAYDHLAALRERFWLVEVLQLSAKGGAFLTLDRQWAAKNKTAKTFVLKTGKSGTHSDGRGRDARDALMGEHGALQRLAGVPGVPEAGELFCDDAMVAALARPYIEGERWWDLWTAPDARTPEARAGFSAALASLFDVVERCHAAGVLIRDLSPGNILWDGAQAHILDFELYHDIGDAAPGYRRGTLGFYDPAVAREAPPKKDVDRYALLALAFMAHTGLHPACLLGGLGDWVENRISVGCAPAFGRAWKEAFSSREDEADFSRHFQGVLKHLSDTPEDISIPWDGQACAVGAENQLRDGLRAFLEMPESEGECNVYSGAAGLIMFAAEWRGAEMADLLSRSAWDAVAEKMTRQAQEILHIPGLYFGASGVALALAALGRFLPSAALRDQSAQLFDAAAEAALCTKIPDLSQGLAGWIMALCVAGDLLEDNQFQRRAHAAGERLVGLAEDVVGGGRQWPWPEGPYGTLSGAAQDGFAHGTAGVVHTLFRLGERTGEASFIEAAEAGLHNLRRNARRHPAGFVWWPPAAGDDAVWNAWCHGTPGVVKAFAQGLRLRPHADDQALVAQALRGIASANNSGFVLCHGIASRLDGHIEGRNALGAAWTPFHGEAEEDARLLASLDLVGLEAVQSRGEAGAEAGGLMAGSLGAARSVLQYRSEMKESRLLP